MTRELAFIVLLLAGCSSQTAAGPTSQKDAEATGLPDGALVITGQLPACNWPASLDSSASRTFLACADCFTHAGSQCSIGVRQG
jgi:hypothetical protein